MGHLLLTTDSEREIVLQEPRTVAITLTVAGVGAALGLWLAVPELRIAQGLFAGFALWMSTRALQRHRLRFDLEHRTVTYHRGWYFASPVQQGNLDAVTAIAIDRYEPTSTNTASRLRSRLLSVELNNWDVDNVVLGFPMGPKIAAEKAEDYARRLGVSVIDRAVDSSVTEPVDDP